MRRRKDGLIEKTVTLDGKRVHVYGHTQAEIKQKIEALYHDLFEGSLGLDKTTPFEKYARHWLELAVSGRSDSDRRHKERDIKYLTRHLGKVPIFDIKRSQIEEALSHYNDIPTTRNSMLRSIRSIYRMAKDDNLALNNPAENIPLLKYEKKERDCFTTEQSEIILNTPLNEEERLFIDLLYYTGIRRGEALGLSRRSIDKGLLHITEQSKEDYDGRPVIGKLKTNNSRRDVPMPPQLEAELRAYVKHCDSIYIFEDIRKRRKFHTFWQRILIKMCQYKNPKFKPPSNVGKWKSPLHITPHWFRHNYASMLYDKGVDVLIAQKLLGHKDVQTTIKIYTHLSERKKKDSFEEIRKLFAAI